MILTLPTHIYNDLLQYLDYKSVNELSQLRKFPENLLANKYHKYGALATNYPTIERVEAVMLYRERWGAKTLRSILYNYRSQYHEKLPIVSYIFDKYADEVCSIKEVRSGVEAAQIRDIFKFLCMSGMTAAVEAMLARYPLNGYRFTIRTHGIYWAAYYNKCETLQLFDDSEVDDECLCVAAQNCHLDTVKLIVSKAERAEIALNFQIALEFAVKFDAFACVSWLIEEKAAQITDRILIYADELASNLLRSYLSQIK